MITVITYDITSNRRLAKMHKFLSDYGHNTQKSVFECDITLEELSEIRKYATELRSITQGRGTFTKEFIRYEEVPEFEVNKIINK